MLTTPNKTDSWWQPSLKRIIETVIGGLVLAGVLAGVQAIWPAAQPYLLPALLGLAGVMVLILAIWGVVGLFSMKRDIRKELVEIRSLVDALNTQARVVKGKLDIHVSEIEDLKSALAKCAKIGNLTELGQFFDRALTAEVETLYREMTQLARMVPSSDQLVDQINKKFERYVEDEQQQQKQRSQMLDTLSKSWSRPPKSDTPPQGT